MEVTPSHYVKEVSGNEPGHPGFLGALQDATTSLWDALSSEVQDDYVQATKEWSADSLPWHIQSRYAMIWVYFMPTNPCE